MLPRATVEAAIETYNEYRSPMATAELVARDGARFAVRFEGPFCRTCCDYDYFEDLLYELDALGATVDGIGIDAITHEGGEAFRVEYAPESA